MIITHKEVIVITSEEPDEFIQMEVFGEKELDSMELHAILEVLLTEAAKRGDTNYGHS